MKIRKAVIPVAGKGTRFLPATKEIPKEMIPLINKPMIHYAVEEAVKSGIEEVIFVTSSAKDSIEDYFDRNFALEEFLQNNNKENLKILIKDIGTMVDVVSVRQKEQLGLGHAILCAKNVVGDEPFAVILADEVTLSETPVTEQLIKTCAENNAESVIGVMKIAKEDTRKYGVVKGNFVENSERTLKMEKMVEKPEPDAAPSNLATPGRYVLSSKIFDYLERIERGVGGEYQLTDAINLMAKEHDVYAHVFEGDRFDTGNVANYLNATVEFALRREDTKDVMREIIIDKIKKYNIKI